jgi:hypothetical protein
VGNFVALTNNFTIMKKILFLLAMVSFLVTGSYAQTGNEKKIKKLKKEIVKKIDRFDDSTTFWSSFKRTSIGWCKHFDKDSKGAIFLRLQTYGETLDIGKKGVYILFEDGTKWNKEWKIDTDEGVGRWWGYKALVLLDYDEVEIFANKKISAFKLYTHEENLSEKEANDIMLLARIFLDINTEAEQ